MVYTPNDKILFGKHRGYKLSEVYRFCPDYLEWAITYKENFCIDITLFQKLPNPTPYKKQYPLSFEGQEALTTFKPKESDIPHAYKALENGEVLLESNYTFPLHIIEINEKKKSNNYVCPEWRSLDETAITSDGLLIKKERKPEDFVCIKCRGNIITGCIHPVKCSYPKFDWYNKDLPDKK